MKLTENQLADELRAMRPLPEPAFAAALDERAAAGLDRRRAGAGLMVRLRKVPPRRMVPVLGAVATLIVVAGVAVSQVGQTETGEVFSGGSDDTLKDASPQLAAPATGEAAAGSVAPAPAPPVRDVARTASMTLSTEPGKVADVAAGVSDVTNRYKGFVVSSSVHISDKGNSGGTLELRIPTAKLQSALADLSDLAHVSARDDGTVDITAKTVSSRDQIAALEKQLAADPTNQAVRDALAAQRDLLRRLEARVQFTPVSVTIRDDAEAGPWTLGDAADDALSVLKAIAGATLVSLAVLVPLALLSALIWLATRGYRRRARENALD